MRLVIDVENRLIRKVPEVLQAAEEAEGTLQGNRSHRPQDAGHHLRPSHERLRVHGGRGEEHQEEVNKYGQDCKGDL